MSQIALRLHPKRTKDRSDILEKIDLLNELHNKSHLFGGGLSGHVQSTVAHGGGSRSEGGGRADEEGGNSELHIDDVDLCVLRGVSKSVDSEVICGWRIVLREAIGVFFHRCKFTWLF